MRGEAGRPEGFPALFFAFFARACNSGGAWACPQSVIVSARGPPEDGGPISQRERRMKMRLNDCSPKRRKLLLAGAAWAAALAALSGYALADQTAASQERQMRGGEGVLTGERVIAPFGAKGERAAIA